MTLTSVGDVGSEANKILTHRKGNSNSILVGPLSGRKQKKGENNLSNSVL